jgi:hypothetical protein
MFENCIDWTISSRAPEMVRVQRLSKGEITTPLSRVGNNNDISEKGRLTLSACCDIVPFKWFKLTIRRFEMNKRIVKEYRIWKAMKSRCYSPSNKDMGYYQKDKIQVCDRWRNNFDNFLKDMGAIPSNKHSIERIDNSKDYCPENCKWIPHNEQSKNTRNVLIFEYNGMHKILKDWSKFFGIKYDTLRGRVVRRGMDFKDAVKNDPYNRLVEINGEKKIVKEWCKYFNINSNIVYSRINKGWDKVKAITTPKLVKSQ